MNQRVLLIREYMKGERTMAALCRHFGVSRKTAYKWLARYNAEGPSALSNRSRAPHTHPRRVEPVVIEALLQARRSHPGWGARKILAWLAREKPELELPCASTANATFERYGLSRSQCSSRTSTRDESA